MTWANDLWDGFTNADKEKIILQALDGFFDPSSELASEKIGALVDADKYTRNDELQSLMGQLVTLFQDEAKENPDFDLSNIIELKTFKGE